MKNLFFITILALSSLFAADPTLSREEKARRLNEINETVGSIKRWQGQYRKKQRNYQSKASRILFKNSTESRQYKELAEEAKNNVKILQDQIELLQFQKEALLSSS